MPSVDLALLFPARGDTGYTTIKATFQEEVKAGEPLEFVSKTNGHVTLKKLTIATKFYGVAVYDVPAGQKGDAMNAGHVNVDALIMPDGLKAIDLTTDANERLILRQEVQ